MIKNIRGKTILLVVVLIAILSSVFVVMSIRQQNQHLKQLIEKQTSTAHFLVNNLQELVFRHYKTRIVSLTRTKEKVITSFAHRDREKLLKTSRKIYQIFTKENSFFQILNFHLPDNTVFLRVHSPKEYGDNVTEIRPMIRKVNQTHKQLSGYEVGRYGLFYRVVQPVFFNDSYVGCVEFGIQHEQLLQFLNTRITPDVAIGINKENWKKATLATVKEHFTVGKSVIFPFDNQLFGKETFFALDKKQSANNQFEFGKQTYMLHSDIELQNFQHLPIANIFIALDITDALESTKLFIIRIVFLALGLVSLATLVLYFSFGQLLNEIFSLNQSLRQKNQNLVKSKCYVENIISSMSDALMVTTPEGQITKVNSSLCNLLDMSEQELLDREVFALFGNPSAAQAIISMSIKEKRTVTSERIFISANKTEYPVLFSATPILNEEKTIFRLVCIATDISARKKAEKVLQNINEELELRVQERTAELAESNVILKQEMEERKRVEEHLRQAQKMKAIGTLAGGIAHDFNNILTGIIGYLELAIEDFPNGINIAPYLNDIYTGVKRAANLVQQILTFSSTHEQEREPVLLHSIIVEALTLLRASIPSNIQIKQYLKAEDTTVFADPNQMHQVIMNLGTNAFQSMLEQGGVLRVNLSKTTINSEANNLDIPVGNYLKLEVIDTGSGINPEALERIFDPYFTTKKKGQGTGLGLSVVHGIVKSHDGHIRVKSILGSGTTITVFFPCQKHSLSPIEKQEEVISVATGKEHILVVDDEEGIIKMLKIMLEGFGYRVTSMSNGLKAYQWFLSNRDSVDLVLMDITMPHMNGLELAGKLSQIRSNLPIILCTGNIENINKINPEDYGARALIRKPFFKEPLARILHQILHTAS